MKATVIRTNRKTMEIQVKSDLTVIVRAPKSASDQEIERILQEKQNWIQKSMERIQAKKEVFKENQVPYLTKDEIQELAENVLMKNRG